MNLDGTESVTFDTGFGANALNGIHAQGPDTGERLSISNTAGRATASEIDGENDGTIEQMEVPLG